MRPSKTASKAMDKLAALLANYGTSAETIEEIKETPTISRDAISRQGEAVLLFLETPAKYTAKMCKRCGEAFGTNYRSVAYCSDTCRAKAISEQLGVKWDWMKSEEERWAGEPPLIIPPKALQKIQEFVQFFADIQPNQIQIQNPPELNPLEVSRQESLVQVSDQLSFDLLETHTTPQQSLPVLFDEEMSEEEFSFDFE